MTDERSLERAARSFIEAGPTRAPEAAVEAALGLIQTTPQERDLRIPRRFDQMSTPARVAAAAALGVLAIGGATFLLGRPNQSDTGGPRPSAPIASPSAARPSPSTSPSPGPLDYSSLEGRILVEHLGNAADLSERDATDYNPDRRRFYFMDPATMTAATTREFLPGQPATGKSAADVSADGKKVVFQDWSDRARLYEANLDGSGFHPLPIECDCSLLYPDYDPTGRRVVYVRVEAGRSWLEIVDLASGATTPIESTRGPSEDAVPEQPSWSPDGKSIAFNRLTWAGGEPVVGTVHYGDHAAQSGVLSLLDVATGTVTSLPINPALLPGDANWSPDSRTIVFAAGPFSTTGSVGAQMPHQVYRIGADGTGLKDLPGLSSPRYTPDGQYILFKDNSSPDGFSIMRPDGSGVAPVNVKGTDLTDLAQGFSYVGHWIPAP